MKEKKTEIITIRIAASLKNELENEANKKEWSLSKMAEKILSTWIEKGGEESMDKQKIFEEIIEIIDGAAEQGFSGEEILIIIKQEIAKLLEINY